VLASDLERKSVKASTSVIRMTRGGQGRFSQTNAGWRDVSVCEREIVEAAFCMSDPLPFKLSLILKKLVEGSSVHQWR
jgi:hypothetical protein